MGAEFVEDAEVGGFEGGRRGFCCGRGVCEVCGRDGVFSGIRIILRCYRQVLVHRLQEQASNGVFVPVERHDAGREFSIAVDCNRRLPKAPHEEAVGECGRRVFRRGAEGDPDGVAGKRLGGLHALPCFAEAVGGVEVSDVEKVKEDGGDVHGGTIGDVVGAGLKGLWGIAEGWAV